METPDARRALLAGLIDHAPTFPPAALPPEAALSEDAKALASPHSWMVGRLVWRASGLSEIAGSERPVSAVLDVPLPPTVTVAAVEVRFDGRLEELPEGVDEAYVELPVDDDLEGRLDDLAARGLRAKVRCGGTHVPTTRELAHFVTACRGRGLIFKATAGLHHAVRTNGEHGLLNLLAAAVFAGDEQAALAESDASAFALDAVSFSWRGRVADAGAAGRARRKLLHSVGSCSFFEPVEELEGLGLLPA